MFDWLRRKAQKAARATPVIKSLMPEQTLWQKMCSGCPDCGQSPIALLEGPSGGMSTNVFCSNCGHGYNITPQLQMAEDIGVNLRYCQNDQIKAQRALDERFNPERSK